MLVTSLFPAAGKRSCSHLVASLISFQVSKPRWTAVYSDVFDQSRKNRRKKVRERSNFEGGDERSGGAAVSHHIEYSEATAREFGIGFVFLK